ncbi:MAG TPA: glycoside hydrolase family 97 protein [Asticcacaulis sp.]|nr:glycoside hydrolase family 97 protein [Asticcacaulis sp.]
MTRFSAASLCALGLLWAGAATAETYTVASPNGRIKVAVDTSAAGLSYAVTLDGKAIIDSSPLGLSLDKGDLGSKAPTLVGHKEDSVDDTYTMVVGRARTVPDHYNLGELDFQDGVISLKYNLLIRAYDNGVALRWLLPPQPGLTDFAIKAEKTQFHFPVDYDCWGANIGHYNSSFEAEYDHTRASLIRNHNLYMAPLVCKTGAGEATFALAEADKRDYAGAFFSGRGDGGLGVEINLSPRIDNSVDIHYNQVAVKAHMPADGFYTPWRVVMIGDHPGDLAASALIPTLGAPSQIKDTSWIKPMKTAWDWWNGWNVDVPHPGINTESYKAYIDFAAAMKLEGILIDEGWYKGTGIEPNPDADPTQALPAMDIPGLVAYGKSKGVGVWLWIQSTHLDPKMDEAFALYERWGVKGVKVDFMNRNDQEMVAWYHKVLSKAAEHHLMVDLHGAYPPDGLLRTWPNYVTQEGVLGAENNKWSTRVTATHNVTLPFTRMILGPMDYTPGGFHSVPAAGFAKDIHFTRPSVMTTRGQAIAMYVVYDSPLQMVSDAPSAYRNKDGSWADGADLIQQVPTSWDETRVLQGDIGQFIVVARRSGETWYIGAMTDETGRVVTVPLDFLKSGNYRAHLWQDGADMNHLAVSDQTVDGGKSLTLTLAESGGAVAVIAPEGKPGKKRKSK